jgi:hypothetical protein
MDYVIGMFVGAGLTIALSFFITIVFALFALRKDRKDRHENLY